MKKYLYEITKGYTTTIEFETYIPSNGASFESIIPPTPWTVTPGVCIARTKKDAIKAVATHIANGGEARLI